MRLIDGDELYKKVVNYSGGAVDKTVAKRLIEQMPTIDSHGNDYISRESAIEVVSKAVTKEVAVQGLIDLPASDVKKTTYCKDCFYSAKEVDTGDLLCCRNSGFLGFPIRVVDDYTCYYAVHHVTESEDD